MKSTNPVFRSVAGYFRSSSGMRERGQTRGCNCPKRTKIPARPSGRGNALARDDDFANLDVGLNVGVVGDVGQEFGGMRREGCLECRDGIEIDVPMARNSGVEPGVAPARPRSMAIPLQAVPILD